MKAYKDLNQLLSQVKETYSVMGQSTYMSSRSIERRLTIQDAI